MKYILILLSFFIVSCSVYKTRRSFSTADISFKGGFYADKEWKSRLRFKRFSWYKGITLSNEILLGKLDSSSDFSHWMGKDRLQLSQCDKYYIALIYNDINGTQGYSYLESELRSMGYDLRIIFGFSKELQAHQNYRDWHLSRHKTYGLCLSADKEVIKVSVPGFGEKVLNL